MKVVQKPGVRYFSPKELFFLSRLILLPLFTDNRNPIVIMKIEWLIDHPTSSLFVYTAFISELLLIAR